MSVSRIKLSADGPEFSRLILGLWRLVDPPALNAQQTLTLIKTSLEAGITTFDEADIYGNYSSEEMFGKALALEPSLRDKIEVVTKCGIKLISDKRPQHLLKHYDTSKEHILRSAEHSLKVMQTDHIDLLLIHRPDPLMDPDEIAEAFTTLKAQGKVLHFGVSNFTVRQFKLMQSRLPFPLVTNQIEISLLHQEPFLDGSIDYCLQHQLAPMAWSPFAGGRLFENKNADQHVRLHNALRSVSQRHAYAAADQLALAWLYKHPAQIIPVIGTSKAERVKSAVEAEKIKLSREDWFELWTAARGEDVPRY